MARTTLNLHINTMTEINRRSAECAVSRRSIIVRLLMMLMRDAHSVDMRFTNVRYQPDDPSGNWHCFSILFREDEHEFFVDLRKIYKCSISLLVAIAVERYLDEVAPIEPIKRHNYARFYNYLIQLDSVDGVMLWRIYWGFPRTEYLTPPSDH